METLPTSAISYLPTKDTENMLGIKLDVRTETAPLEAVVVGLAIDEGTAHLQNNPKMIEHVEKGTYPGESVLVGQVGNLVRAMQKEGVIVYRPTNVKEVNQIFTRDIGFVVDDTFVVANMKRDNRKPEFDGIQHILDLVKPEKVIRATGEATFEGGDILVHNEHIFVGISKRTNWAGYEFLKESFPNKQVHALEVLVTE
ncbi:MAG: N-dimethylarginine dimethylaminohydrolase, partial [Flammeovirgaceae bacterium]